MSGSVPPEQRTPRFDADFEALRPEHRKHFLAVIPAFSRACDAYAADPASHVWLASLRVSWMVGAPGIWEMTWSFASPDGRATSELLRAQGEVRVRWRRIGDHSVYRAP